MSTAPVGFVDVTMVLTNDLSTKDNTWGFGLDPDGSDWETDVTGLALAIYGCFTGDSSVPYDDSHILTHWSFVGVSAAWSTEDGPIIDQHFDPVASGASGETIPINCAVLLKKNTASGGRRNRGRAFLPPCFPTEANVDGVGTVFSGSLSDMQDWYGGAYDNMVALSLQPVLFHAEAPFTPTALTGWSVQSKIATQRRRLRG